MDKEILRKKYLNLRLDANINVLNQKNVKISENLFNLLISNFSHIKTIAGYFPINNEVNLLELYNKLKNFYNIVLPKINTKTKLLKFHKFQNYNELIKGKYGIYEPSNTDELKPEIIIIPSLACDLQGIRLGYGGGFYDYTIGKLQPNKNITIIAPCFDFQIAKKLPCFEHDKKIDIIVTDEQIIYV